MVRRLVQVNTDGKWELPGQFAKVLQVALAKNQLSETDIQLICEGAIDDYEHLTYHSGAH